MTVTPELFERLLALRLPTADFVVFGIAYKPLSGRPKDLAQLAALNRARQGERGGETSCCSG